MIIITDIHILTVVHLSLHESFVTNQRVDLLPVGWLAQLEEHCTGIAQFRGSTPVHA